MRVQVQFVERLWQILLCEVVMSRALVLGRRAGASHRSAGDAAKPAASLPLYEPITASAILAAVPWVSIVIAIAPFGSGDIEEEVQL